MSRPRILSVIGTRPEAIKLAPVVRAIQECNELEGRVCITAQHRELLDPLLRLNGIEPHYDLDVMSPGQDLCDITSRILVGMRDVLQRECPDVVLVQGDTTTAFSTALAAFYLGIPVAHVEAGLRTGNFDEPFPEEVNRVLIARLCTWYFAPSLTARNQLLTEGVAPARIRVVGNTAIDSLDWIRERLPCLSWEETASLIPVRFLMDRNQKSRVILVTVHRRENLGGRLTHICNALLQLAACYPDVHFVLPVHPNPQVQLPVRAALSGLPNIHLLDPLSHPAFVRLLERCTFVVTDSGGVQEEAPSLGKPVLVLRGVTERQEGVDAGTSRLIGTNTDRIVAECARLLENENVLEAMGRIHHPYGDGQAAPRIVATLLAALVKSPLQKQEPGPELEISSQPFPSPCLRGGGL